MSSLIAPQSAVLAKPSDLRSVHTVRGACPHDCPDTCALITTVENGVAISVKGDPDHPPTHGTLCAKVSRYPERTYHADRLLHPLKRVGKKGEGKFVRVSWSEALDDIAARLKTIAARNPEAIVPYSYAGTMGLVQGESMAARFFHKLGASFLDRTICATAGGEAMLTTLGVKMGTQVESFAHSKLIIIWGSNSITSNLHFWTFAQQAKRNGAKLICIDPWRNDTAEKCHQHIQIQPGTDAALALGVMRELIHNNWLDKAYIQQYTLGYEELCTRCELYTAEYVAKVCKISADEVRQLARDYATLTPAAIRVNYGLQRVRGGGNAVRAICCLPALTGSWRHASGGLLLSSSGTFGIDEAALQRPDLLAGKKPRTINMSTIGHDLLHATPKIESLIVYNSNPVAVAPHSGEVVQGFAREDLFTVVLEHFQTDTADYADYILPATTQLEHLDVVKPYGHVYMMANNAAIAPLGEAKTNTHIFRELSARMGFDEPCFRETDDQIAAKAINQSHTRMQGISWQTMKDKGWQKLNIPEAPFAQGGFATPSGKCEFDSSVLRARGEDGVPHYIAPYESEASSPELVKKYPLAMISPPARNFLNSTFVNVQSLRDREGEPYLLIHPDDATSRGITDLASIIARNDRGTYHSIAKITNAAKPGVVIGLGVWWRKLGANGTNVNELTHQQLTDMGKGACFYDCLVQVELA
jgi:anaerobic selenocysteine-containing dehydrogenase